MYVRIILERILPPFWKFCVGWPNRYFQLLKQSSMYRKVYTDGSIWENAVTINVPMCAWLLLRNSGDKIIVLLCVLVSLVSLAWIVYAFLMVLSTVLFVGRVSWKIVAISVGNDSKNEELIKLFCYCETLCHFFGYNKRTSSELWMIFVYSVVKTKLIKIYLMIDLFAGSVC